MCTICYKNMLTLNDDRNKDALQMSCCSECSAIHPSRCTVMLRVILTHFIFSLACIKISSKTPVYKLFGLILSLRILYLIFLRTLFSFCLLICFHLKSVLTKIKQYSPLPPHYGFNFNIALYFFCEWNPKTQSKLRCLNCNVFL